MVITASPYRPTNHINHQNWDIFHSSISKISSYPTASRKKDLCIFWNYGWPHKLSYWYLDKVLTGPNILWTVNAWGFNAEFLPRPNWCFGTRKNLAPSAEMYGNMLLAIARTDKLHLRFIFKTLKSYKVRDKLQDIC